MKALEGLNWARDLRSQLAFVLGPGRVSCQTAAWPCQPRFATSIFYLGRRVGADGTYHTLEVDVSGLNLKQSNLSIAHPSGVCSYVGVDDKQLNNNKKGVGFP